MQRSADNLFLASLRGLRSAGFIVMLSLAIGQYAAASPGRGTERIIVAFTESVVHPDEPGFIDDLSDYVGVPLSYLRTLSGGAHIMGINRPLNDAQLKRVIRQLSRREDVVYVKEDNVAFHRPAARRVVTPN